ncbi:hypothetical protein SAMN07250955_1233 [Arboricoccus pini]|uniref:Uncharacterized protein n=1 Tax=Arboricoccus pini TaxID=1963835 RepID=A0A212S434_9PROT|nr:hypothetical protein [Arboricoccus pini]SNB79783.1 hypothetical protein SAMN07250955_1233 [Arboricoccus pini]
MEPDPEDKLQLQFLSTAEMTAWADFQDQVEAAIDAGDATVPVPTDFLALILPEVKSSPLQFEALRAVWNRVCDEQGMAHLKRETPATPADEDSSDDGPF